MFLQCHIDGKPVEAVQRPFGICKVVLANIGFSREDNICRTSQSRVQ